MLLNFFGTLDCLDIDKSEIYIDDDDDERTVKRFYLSQNVLDNIEEEKRLIFSIAKTDHNYTFVHQKIKNLFDEANATGVKFIKVSEYKSGSEYDQ